MLERFRHLSEKISNRKLRYARAEAQYFVFRAPVRGIHTQRIPVRERGMQLGVTESPSVLMHEVMEKIFSPYSTDVNVISSVRPRLIVQT